MCYVRLIESPIVCDSVMPRPIDWVQCVCRAYFGKYDISQNEK